MKIETVAASIISAISGVLISIWKGRWESITLPQKEKTEEIRNIVIQLNEASYKKTILLIQKLKTYIYSMEHADSKDGDNFLCEVHIWDVIHKIEKKNDIGQKQLLIEYLNLLLVRKDHIIKNNIKNKVYDLVYWVLLIMSSIFFFFALQKEKFQMEIVVWSESIYIIFLFIIICWLEGCKYVSDFIVKAKKKNFKSGYKESKKKFIFIVWMVHFLVLIPLFFSFSFLFSYLDIKISHIYLFATFVMVYIAMLDQSLKQIERYIDIYKYNKAIYNSYINAKKCKKKIKK